MSDWYWVKIDGIWSPAVRNEHKYAAGRWTNLDTWEDWDNEVTEFVNIPSPDERGSRLSRLSLLELFDAYIEWRSRAESAGISRALTPTEQDEWAIKYCRRRCIADKYADEIRRRIGGNQRGRI